MILRSLLIVATPYLRETLENVWQMTLYFMSHMWMSHVTRTNVSVWERKRETERERERARERETYWCGSWSAHLWRIDMWTMWLIRLIHLYATNHNVCAMTYSYVCHDSFSYVPWLIRLIHIYATTHSHLCHDSFLSVPWLIPVCAMAHSICVPWPYVCHDSRTCVPWLTEEEARVRLCKLVPASVERRASNLQIIPCVPWVTHMCVSEPTQEEAWVLLCCAVWYSLV